MVTTETKCPDISCFLIKIIGNIKKLSEAKNLEEFVQILRDLGYTGNTTI